MGGEDGISLLCASEMRLCEAASSFSDRLFSGGECEIDHVDVLSYCILGFLDWVREWDRIEDEIEYRGDAERCV